MILRSATWGAVLIGLVPLGGCFFPVREKIDASVCDIAKQPFDVQRLEAADQRPLMPPAENGSLQQTSSEDDEDDIVLAAAEADDPSGEQPRKRFDPYKDLQGRRVPLQVPPDLLPNGPPRELKLGPLTPENAARRREILRREFPPLRPPGPDYEGRPGPYGHPLTLGEMQQIGLSSSPNIKQAVAAVEVARGNALQAGLMPNPTLGFEVDTFGTTGGAGYAGGYMEQLIKTAGKLRLSRAVAAMDLRNAEVALRRAQMDLATGVRTYYFQLLVARENMRINRIMVAFTNAVYEVQAGQMRGKAEAVAPTAAYEPMYLRALATTARTNLVAARNSYTTAWKQLAATMGIPGLPLTQVQGRVDMPVPVFDFAKVWLRVGASHTDVATADNELQEARFALRLAQVQPYPDFDVRFLIQKDYTGPPNEISPSIAVSVPVPIWNRNQGGIAAAQANVVQMGEEPLRVRKDLYYRLSDAFNRYRTFRENLTLYRDRILPDLVRVYNSIYERYHVESAVVGPPPAALPGVQPPPPLGINDIVVAQQLLTTAVASYITNLGGMWQAVVDVTDLIQTNDMFRMAGQPLPTEPVPVLPDLQQLKPLLRTHPCSPLPDPRLRGGDGSWPEAIPTTNNYPMPSADSEARGSQSLPSAVAAQPAPLPAVTQPSSVRAPERQAAVNAQLLEAPPLVPSQ